MGAFDDMVLVYVLPHQVLRPHERPYLATRSVVPSRTACCIRVFFPKRLEIERSEGLLEPVVLRDWRCRWDIP